MNKARVETTELAWVLDCEAEGCNPPHEDAALVHPLHPNYGEPEPGEPRFTRVNGHAIKWLRRRIVYEPWEKAP